MEKITVCKNLTDNLCDGCVYNIPECNPEIIEFGDGVGNDNVIKCDQFQDH